MGRIIAYIMAVLFALCAFAILTLVVWADILRTKEYICAHRIMARVNGRTGDHKTSNYGLRQPPTKYHAYQVTYAVGDRICSGIYLCKKDVFKEGDAVEIRYVIQKDGRPEIVNRDIKDRLLRILLCMAIAVPICVIGIVWCK